MSHTSSARVISVFDNYPHYFFFFDIIFFNKSGCGARVTVYGMSGTEGQDLGGTDQIDLQLPRGATSSGTPQKSTPKVHTSDRHAEFVASDAVSWRQGKFFFGWKWSFLIAVRAISKPLYEGLKKIEDNMNQDFRKSRLSIEELELPDQAYTLSALFLQR